MDGIFVEKLAVHAPGHVTVRIKQRRCIPPLQKKCLRRFRRVRAVGKGRSPKLPTQYEEG